MKTALITGATSGIGKATAKLFAEQGFKRVICGRRTEVLEELKVELSRFTEVFALNFDQRIFSEVEKAILSLPENFKNISLKNNDS